jgi:hypothetical protein
VADVIECRRGRVVLVAEDRRGTRRHRDICVVRLAIKIPSLLDGIDNQVERAYTGWPDRLYVIGTDGRIRYKSAPGPYGFSTKRLEEVLTQLSDHPSTY